MSIQVEGSKNVILERAAELPPRERLYYLEQVSSMLNRQELKFIDTEHGVDASPEIHEWLKNLLREEAIPDEYFGYSIDRLLERIHPIMQKGFLAGLVERLSELDEQSAKAEGILEGFSPAQCDVLYVQMQAWLAQFQKPRLLN